MTRAAASGVDVAAEAVGAPGRRQELHRPPRAGGARRTDRAECSLAKLTATSYLRASGALGNLRRAPYAYNHSTLCVDAVLAYARFMCRNVRAFYGFHAWQVFVRTPTGYRRITSP